MTGWVITMGRAELDDAKPPVWTGPLGDRELAVLGKGQWARGW